LHPNEEHPVQGLNWGETEPRKSRRGRWTRAEIDWLHDVYGLRDEQAIARELGRSPHSVRRMAEEIFRGARAQGPWTAGEIERLKVYLGATSPEVIAMVLGRDEREVQEQIFELGRIQQGGRWTNAEMLRFRRLYGTRSDENLAAIFGRSLDAVQRLAKRFCLAKDKAFLKKQRGEGATQMPRWSNSELNLLRELYPRTPNLEIARQLNRSVKSIVSKAHHFGLKKELERLREMGRENVSLRYQKT
jgi:hypothetical protein